MEFKHSRAPWVAVINTDLDLPSGLIKSGDKSIAHTLQKAIGVEQARANTYLIFNRSSTRVIRTVNKTSQ